MAGLGIGLFFGGYSLLYYGLSQVTGHNFGFFDLTIPSKWAAIQANPPKNDDASTPKANKIGNNALGLVAGAGQKLATTTTPINPLGGTANAILGYLKNIL